MVESDSVDFKTFEKGSVKKNVKALIEYIKDNDFTRD